MEFDNITPENRKPLLKGWIRALLIIIPFIIVTAVMQLIGYLLLGLDIADESVTMTETTVLRIIVTAGTLLIVFIFTHYIDRADFKSLGFQLKDFRKNMLLGIVMGALIMAIGFCILFMLDEIRVTAVTYDTYKLLTSVVLFSVVAFGEELIMRGYILNNLLQSMNKYVALALSSVIFSIMHIFNPNFDMMSFVSIVLAGLMLGISYIYTKNLWFPVALHFSWNFFQGTVFGFKVSGQEIYSVIIQHPTENNILSGGEFGFEGSIVSQIFIVIATLAIWMLAKQNPADDKK
ncbi:MAG: CPBP family intramembrane metalloprotease, partial [Prevotellaceae bacterium]|nr:CPBP family intramembrane metalloprotease [Prevotellaceae bacterium]